MEQLAVDYFWIMVWLTAALILLFASLLAIAFIRVITKDKPHG